MLGGIDFFISPFLLFIVSLESWLLGFYSVPAWVWEARVSLFPGLPGCVNFIRDFILCFPCLMWSHSPSPALG